MECIKYINDLNIEIEILNDLKKSLDCSKAEKEEIEEKIRRKSIILEKCKNNLSKLSSDQICYRIYVKILNGYSLSKAIELVAEENFLNDEKPYHINSIWRNYYPKLKKILKV